MTSSKIFLVLLPLLALAGCATSKDWSAAGGDREAGIVKVSYSYAKFQERSLSDEQAEQIAERRCGVWGYAHADEIPGQLRECASSESGSCTVWTVTREYHCSGDAKMARGGEVIAEGATSARLAPYRAAR